MTCRKLFDSTSEVTVIEAFDCAILSSCGRKKLVICDWVLYARTYGANVYSYISARKQSFVYVRNFVLVLAATTPTYAYDPCHAAGTSYVPPTEPRPTWRLLFKREARDDE